MVYRTIILLLLVTVTWEINFDKTIVAVHFPHYKILLSLGDCKGSLVSRVEINLVVNNTEFLALAYNDIGTNEFKANVLFPIHSGPTFYSLDIFTCSPVEKKYMYGKEEELDSLENIETLSKMPFYIKKIPALI